LKKFNKQAIFSKLPPPSGLSIQSPPISSTEAITVSEGRRATIIVIIHYYYESNNLTTNTIVMICPKAIISSGACISI
jgi:hypothetical protein